ncbi:UNVERIFIED_CONTAM: hypothetical protein Scaly_0673100 [Sesamum calycinum]|uniref:SWIM-type domain-containing protein n=1 Tax=Sesamum calycinum TaxID=2727403 RepID=A0AAW2R5T1_9LAMI
MLEWLMEYLMKRLQQNRDRASKKWKRVLCPKIQKIIDKNIEKLGDCIPIKSDDKHYQISCFDGTQYSVDLENGTCGCRKWDLSGIPCKHAVSAIFCQGEDIEKYTHQCYRVQTYLKAYQHPIFPINGRDEWKKSDLSPPVPPKAVKRVGRPPKSSRRLEVDEPVQKNKKRRGAPMKEGSSRIKRQQTTVKCGKCGGQGHNARGCATKTASNEPVPDASSQVPPTEQPQKSRLEESVKASCKMQMLSCIGEQEVCIQGKLETIVASVQEEDGVMHRRTRSGHIPVAAPVIRKLQDRKAPKPSATAPSMFHQFQQCQKGVKIKEPAPFIDVEVGGRSLDEQGSSGSTPSIVKGGKKFVTMSNISNAISELNKGKKKA